MEELRPIWRSVFFARRVLACIVSRLWSSEEEFKASYKRYSRPGDDELVKEMFNPSATPRGRKTA